MKSQKVGGINVRLPHKCKDCGEELNEDGSNFPTSGSDNGQHYYRSQCRRCFNKYTSLRGIAYKKQPKMPVESKVCSKCKTKKSAKEFASRPERPSGLYSCCKECKRDYRIARYKQQRQDDPISLWIKNAYFWAKDRARKKQIAFSLTRQDVEAIHNETNSRCVYCNVTFNYRRTIKTRRDSPTLDRLLPSVGYVKGNIVVCCFRCNALKNDATADELRMIADRMDQMLEK